MSSDPGLQAERTALSWQRTTLSTLVIAILAWRDALLTIDSRPPVQDTTAALAGALLVSLGVVVFAILTGSRNRSLRHDAVARAAVHRVPIGTVAVVLVAAGALLLVLR